MKGRGTAKLYYTIRDLRRVFVHQKCPETGAEEAIMWWARNIIPDEEKYYRGIDNPEPLWKPESVIIIRPGDSAGQYNQWHLSVYCDANGVITDVSTG